VHLAILPGISGPGGWRVPDCRDVTTAKPVQPRWLLDRLLVPGREGRLTHVEVLPERAARTASWPHWADGELVAAYKRIGIDAPWTHQVLAAGLAWTGQHVVIATGTASGKSLAYTLPALTTVLQGRGQRRSRDATVLYVSPTKALANDQLGRLLAMGLEGARITTVDGDSPLEQRDWARDYAHVVLTNPDMLHRTLLPAHWRWAKFLSALRYVVIDECHHYRGVFGAHVAEIVRRLRRLCRLYGASPTFVLASATTAEPAVSAGRLTGLSMRPVTDDGSPRGSNVVGLWEPPLTALAGEHGAPIRRTATAETADLLADLISEGVRTLAFVRSRRGAETVALTAKAHLAEVSADLSQRVASYRAGYLPEDRRELESALRTGELLGVAATNALELGIDIAGLDAVLIAGFPGTRASLWQQIGRAGREASGALAVLVARDDPLDTYLVNHPAALFGQPVEASVLDPDNPYVLAPHLCAAAAESPLTEDDLRLFGPASGQVVASLVDRGALRRRPRGWFWTSRDRASDLADIRSTGGHPVRVVEESTGRLLGTVDSEAAHSTVHRGAVYLHMGLTYLVSDLSLDEHVAVVARDDPDYSTTAREVTDISILDSNRVTEWGSSQLCFGTVQVSSQVVGFLRRRLVTGEVLGEEPLDLPVRTLPTRSVWWVMPSAQIASTGLDPVDLPGAAHAAEHASIGLLPLFATCDRWDIGGVSTAHHVDTGELTVFVYDGHPGGAGFAERGYAAAGKWLLATKQAIESCACAEGCPSCVQSPKCGNGNIPLDKDGAIRLLEALLSGAK
jgi:DEAD/DEAH box helicase domain-containing protein